MAESFKIKEGDAPKIISELVAQKFKIKNNRRNTAYSLDVPKDGLKMGDEFNLERFFNDEGDCVKMVFSKVK